MAAFPARHLAAHSRRIGRAATAGGAAVVALLAAAAAIGCRSGGAHGSEREASARCTSDRPGVLRVANFTGRVIEIYALRPVDHWRVFVAQVSTGTTELPVPGPADLGVRYDAVEPAHGEPLGTVTWIRSTSRTGGSTSLVLELTCAREAA